MPSQGPNSPSSGTNVAPGPGNDINGAWMNPGDITAADGTASQQTGTSGSSIRDTWCQLTKNGTAAVGTNQIGTPTDIPASYTYLSVGGSNVLWGTTLSQSEVNASTFGVMYATQSAGGSGTNWLVATGFGFTVPAGATIDGVLAEILRAQPSTGTSVVDYIRVTVYYTAGTTGRISRVSPLDGLGGVGQKRFNPSLGL